MRNTLAFLAAVLLTVTAAGWYLDWYTIRPQPTATGRHSYNIEINTSKIGQDLSASLRSGEQKVKNLLDRKNQESTCQCEKEEKTTPPDKVSLEEEAEPEPEPFPEGELWFR
jgi:hypothetical protein